MIEKSLVIINESFSEMVLGKNTTLAYIAAALDLEHEVYIYNLPKTGNIFPKNLHDFIEAIKITPKSEQAKILIQKYKSKNHELADFIVRALNSSNMLLLQNYDPKVNPQGYQILKVADLELKFTNELVLLSEITNVIQRLEPMKEPFPPQGDKNFAESLHEIKKLFPHLSFNCPIYYEKNAVNLLIDKEIPQKINELLEKKGEKGIATPTKEFSLEDKKNFIANSCKEMSKEYKMMFLNNKNSKIILKPKDSAQSLGVMALELCNNQNAYDLEKLEKSTHAELEEQQIYKIKSNLTDQEFVEIIKVLCYLESLKTSDNFLQKKNLKISEVSKEEQKEIAKKLYDKVIVQPFLEGVKFGDIRVNIIKNKQDNFEVFGITFRRSNRIVDDKFTTCLTTGGSSPFPIYLLTKEEQKNLYDKINLTCELLNSRSPISEQFPRNYKFTTELGVDFLLQGDGKNVFLGEINHHCPALAPTSEIMKNIIEDQNGFYLFNSKSNDYDYGLKAAKSAIISQIN